MKKKKKGFVDLSSPSVIARTKLSRALNHKKKKKKDSKYKSAQAAKYDKEFRDGWFSK